MKDWEIEAWKQQRSVGNQVTALAKSLATSICDACGSDPCICAGLQKQAETEQAKFEAEETARHAEWLASKDDLCDSCGLDPCQCDRYFAEQNADYEGLVY